MTEASPTPPAPPSLPDPSHPDFSYESSPHLYIFTSLTAGSSQIITATSRLETILKAHRIPFHAIDTATDDKARKIWTRRSAGKKLPGLVKDGYVVADLEAVEEWNEYGELKDMLGAKGEGGAAQPLLLGGATPVTGKENAKAMAKAGYGVSGPAAEGIDTAGAARSRIGAFEKRSSLGGEQQVQQKQSALAAEAAAMGSVRANRAKFEAVGGGGGGPAMFKRRVPSGVPKAEASEKEGETSASTDQPATTEPAKAEDVSTIATKASETTSETTTGKLDDTAGDSAQLPDTPVGKLSTSKEEDTTTSSAGLNEEAASMTTTPMNNTETASTPSDSKESAAALITSTKPVIDTTTSPGSDALKTETTDSGSGSSKAYPHPTFDTTPRHTSPPPLHAVDSTGMSTSPPSATATVAFPAIPKDELRQRTESPTEETGQDAQHEMPAIVVQDAETDKEKDTETIARENDVVAEHAEVDIAKAVESEGQAAEGAAPASTSGEASMSAGGHQHVHFKGNAVKDEPPQPENSKKEPSQEETKVLEEKLEGVDIKAAEQEQKEAEQNVEKTS